MAPGHIPEDHCTGKVGNVCLSDHYRIAILVFFVESYLREVPGHGSEAERFGSGRVADHPLKPVFR